MERSLLKDILLKQSSLLKLLQKNPQSVFEDRDSVLKNTGIIIAYLYNCSCCLTCCKGNYSLNTQLFLNQGVQLIPREVKSSD